MGQEKPVPDLDGGGEGASRGRVEWPQSGCMAGRGGGEDGASRLRTGHAGWGQWGAAQPNADVCVGGQL